MSLHLREEARLEEACQGLRIVSRELQAHARPVAVDSHGQDVQHGLDSLGRAADDAHVISPGFPPTRPRLKAVARNVFRPGASRISYTALSPLAVPFESGTRWPLR